MKITSITETTTSGSVAPVAQAFKAVQKREDTPAKKGGNLLKGITTSAKYANSLHEVSNELLGRYKKAAGADASAADKKGDFKKGDKRFKGIVKATNKEFDNDKKSKVAESLDYENMPPLFNDAQSFFRKLSPGQLRSEQSKLVAHYLKQRNRGRLDDKSMLSIYDALQSVQEEMTEPVDESAIKESDLIRSPGKGRQYKPGLLNKPEVSLNPTDVVKVDVPLLIRLLEYAKEDAPDDMALHALAEKLVAGCVRGKTLTMRDYDMLMPEMAEGFGGAVAGATIGLAAPELGGPVTGAKVGSAIQDAFGK